MTYPHVALNYTQIIFLFIFCLIIIPASASQDFQLDYASSGSAGVIFPNRVIDFNTRFVSPDEEGSLDGSVRSGSVFKTGFSAKWAFHERANLQIGINTAYRQINELYDFKVRAPVNGFVVDWEIKHFQQNHIGLIEVPIVGGYRIHEHFTAKSGLLLAFPLLKKGSLTSDSEYQIRSGAQIMDEDSRYTEQGVQPDLFDVFSDINVFIPFTAGFDLTPSWQVRLTYYLALNDMAGYTLSDIEHRILAPEPVIPGGEEPSFDIEDAVTMDDGSLRQNILTLSIFYQWDSK